MLRTRLASVIDTYAKVAAAKLYGRKTLTTVADLLSDRVLWQNADAKFLDAMPMTKDKMIAA